MLSSAREALAAWKPVSVAATEIISKSLLTSGPVPMTECSYSRVNPDGRLRELSPTIEKITTSRLLSIVVTIGGASRVALKGVHLSVTASTGVEPTFEKRATPATPRKIEGLPDAVKFQV